MATKDSSLKVALVHDSLTVPGGAEKVLYQLHTLFPDAPIYTPLYRPEKFPEFGQATVIPSALNRFAYPRNHHQFFIPLMPYYIEQFDLSAYDVVISDSSAVAKGVLTRPETLHLCYCHTPMRWAWLPYLDRRAASSWLRRVAAHYLRIWDVSTVPRVDAWMANSKTAASRMAKFYGVKAEILYPPVDVNDNAIEMERDDYYVTTGRLVAQKRVDVIVEAAKKAGFNLKIIGDGPFRQKLEHMAKGAKNIEFLGRVSDTVRDALHGKAKGFIFASEEDAGIVPLEAMVCGTPVICYGKGGGSETVLNKKTGLHFSQQTADSLILALSEFEKLTFDPKAIADHASQFTPAKFRQKITDFLKEALETHQSSLER